MPSLEMWWSTCLLLAACWPRCCTENAESPADFAPVIRDDSLLGNRFTGRSRWAQARWPVETVIRCSGATMRLSLLGPIRPPSSSPAATDPPLSLNSYETPGAKLAIHGLPFLLPMQ